MYVASMCAMPSSSKEQNKALKRDIEAGLTCTNCFIKVDNNQVVCRAVVYQDIHYVGCITVEDIDQKEIDDFLQTVCNQLDHTKEWRIDLYSDKIHHDKLYYALKNLFPIEIKRESYTCVVERQSEIPYLFKSVVSFTREEIIKLMAKSSKTTLDVAIQREQQLLGVKASMEQMYEQFIVKKDSDELFQVLLIKDALVGFIAIYELTDGVGGIGYIGVDPRFQGNHYSTILLRKAQNMAYQHGMHKLIGDFDVHNFSIAYNLQQADFRKDCSQSTFLRPKKDNM